MEAAVGLEAAVVLVLLLSSAKDPTLLLHSLFRACQVGRRLLVTMVDDADIDVAVDRTVEVVSSMVVLKDYADSSSPPGGGGGSRRFL